MDRRLALLAALALIACSGSASEDASAGAPPPSTPIDAGAPSRDAAAPEASAPDAGAARDAAPQPSGGFRHPGVLVDGAGLDFVRAQIAVGAEPWTSALAAAKSSRYASPSYAPAPVADVVCGPYSNPDVGCTAEKSDAAAAYTDALLWALTGDAAHADEAIRIMNAWSAVLREHTDSNAPLQSAWVASVFARAAEIVRWTGAAWAPADEARFASMLRTIYLPEIVHGAANENGNWELSMAEGTLAIGVFLDDRATFDAGLAMWRARVPAYVYLTSDGPTPVPPPGGNAKTPSQIASYWYGQTTYVDGLSQETCRDLGHVQYGLAAMIDGAETARIQGVDLFAEQAPRIAAGLELHAGFLDGAAVPKTICGGTLNAVTPDPTWEIALAEFGRLGVPLPNVRALVQRIRPTGVDHHMEWETLTHAR